MAREVKTTLYISHAIRHALRRFAADSDRTLTEVVDAALREYLGRNHYVRPETAVAETVASKVDKVKRGSPARAARDEKARRERPTPRISLRDELLAIGKRCACLPDLDTRSADEILGYDEHGLPR